jgi:hypothetical protein
MKVLLQGSADLAASKAQLGETVAVFTQLQELCLEHFKEEEVCVWQAGKRERGHLNLGGLSISCAPDWPMRYFGHCNCRVGAC